MTTLERQTRTTWRFASGDKTTMRWRFDEIKKAQQRKSGGPPTFLLFSRVSRTLVGEVWTTGVWGWEHLNKFVLCCLRCIFFFTFPRSLHPVSFVKLRFVLRVGVLHGDAAWQDGGHVIADTFVLSLLFSLLLHFPQLDACRGENQQRAGKDFG